MALVRYIFYREKRSVVAVQFEDAHECLLRHLDRAQLAHALLALIFF